MQQNQEGLLAPHIEVKSYDRSSINELIEKLTRVQITDPVTMPAPIIKPPNR